MHEDKKDDVKIGHDNISDIKDFAQSEMVKTFIYGMSKDALERIDNVFVKITNKCCDELVSAGHLKASDEVEKHKSKARSDFTDEISIYISGTHSQPLRNVIGMLSIDELAQLAETLISIESLKERVTRSTESVSGPVDVAVISKTDGFIWLKRKHYFDQKLNPRFQARLNREAVK